VTVLELPVVPPVALGVVWVNVAVLVTVEVAIDRDDDLCRRR